MGDGRRITIDGNEAAASVAHRLSEVIAIYPITPSSAMGELAGLDHVLAGRRDVNVLVLDTEVYSNTGGQQSKATPMGAVARFAEAGKQVPKKDLALMAMSYGHVYVARVALGAKVQQTVQALLEAESWPGPSLVIAYSPCIAHGYDLAKGPEQQRLAVDSGVWPLARFDPRRADAGEPALRLDSGPPKIKVADYARNEARFRRADTQSPEEFSRLGALAQRNADQRYALYQQLAAIKAPGPAAKPEPEPVEA